MRKGKDVGLGGLVGALDGLRDLIDGTAEARIAASIHDGRGASVEYLMGCRKRDGARSERWAPRMMTMAQLRVWHWRRTA